MIVTNFDEKAWYWMMDKHYWYFMEPVFVEKDGKEIVVNKYVRLGPEYIDPRHEEHRSGLRKFIDLITSPFSHLFAEPISVRVSQVIGRNPMQKHVPDYIVEHFERYKNVPGTFSFYELDGKLYFSTVPAVGLSKEEPCSYIAYRTIAETFGLNLPPVIAGDRNLWIFNRLGENFRIFEDFEAWRQLVRAETGCNVYLATATGENNK